MGVKISELPVTSSAASTDDLVVNRAGETSRLTLEDLMKSGMEGTGLVTETELQEYLEDYVSVSC